MPAAVHLWLHPRFLEGNCLLDQFGRSCAHRKITSPHVFKVTFLFSITKPNQPSVLRHPSTSLVHTNRTLTRLNVRLPVNSARLKRNPPAAGILVCVRARACVQAAREMSQFPSPQQEPGARVKVWRLIGFRNLATAELTVAT